MAAQQAKVRIIEIERQHVWRWLGGATKRLVDQLKAGEVMGQAKSRGSKDERIAQARGASHDSTGAVELVRRGEAPHYAFVIDRSQVGQRLLQGLRDGPAEVRARVTSEAFKLWESAPHFTYLVIWGTWGWSGGLTIPTVDLDTLLNQALPKVMERTIEKGGLCSWMPAVAEDVQQQVMARLAELQPTPGSSDKAN